MPTQVSSWLWCGPHPCSRLFYFAGWGCRARGLSDIENAGAGRILTLEEPVTLDVLIARVKKHLKLDHIRVAVSLATLPQDAATPASVTSVATSVAVQKIAACAGYVHCKQRCSSIACLVTYSNTLLCVVTGQVWCVSDWPPRRRRGCAAYRRNVSS